MDYQQKVRTILTINSAKFNGILNAWVLFPNRPPAAVNKLGPLYSQVRDSYRSHNHRFKRADRDELDAVLDQIDGQFDPRNSVKVDKNVLLLMSKFLRDLEVNLNR